MNKECSFRFRSRCEGKMTAWSFSSVEFIHENKMGWFICNKHAQEFHTRRRRYYISIEEFDLVEIIKE